MFFLRLDLNDRLVVDIVLESLPPRFARHGDRTADSLSYYTTTESCSLVSYHTAAASTSTPRSLLQREVQEAASPSEVADGAALSAATGGVVEVAANQPNSGTVEPEQNKKVRPPF